MIPCNVQSHLSTMNLNEIQEFVVELQDTYIWLKMPYKEKTPFSYPLKSYNETMSSWTPPKAIVIRADIKHLRAYKIVVLFFSCIPPCQLITAECLIIKKILPQ